MIKIYGREMCNFCDRAMMVCEQYGLEYTYKNVDDRFEGATYMAELKALAEEQNLTFKTVPQIWMHGKYVGGYNELLSELENGNIGNFGQGAV